MYIIGNLDIVALRVKVIVFPSFLTTCMAMSKDLILCFTKGIDAVKSVFMQFPGTIIPLFKGVLGSNMRAIKVFHKTDAL